MFLKCLHFDFYSMLKKNKKGRMLFYEQTQKAVHFKNSGLEPSFSFAMFNDKALKSDKNKNQDSDDGDW